VALQQELNAGLLQGKDSAGSAPWLFSWPLLAAVWAYLHALYLGKDLLLDGDTYWHIAAGRWILDKGAVPATDPFSHSMPGAAWTAHE
jgi:hypothetical protein